MGRVFVPRMKEKTHPRLATQLNHELKDDVTQKQPTGFNRFVLRIEA